MMTWGLAIVLIVVIWLAVGVGVALAFGALCHTTRRWR